MKTSNDVRAGALTSNHNETLVHVKGGGRRGMKVQTGLKAGGLDSSPHVNHNETILAARMPASTPARK